MRCFLILVVTLAAFVASGCSKQAKSSDKPEATRAVFVRTTTVEQKAIVDEVAVTGTIKPQAQVQLVSELSARLVKLNKDEGMPVAKGEVIAMLDCTDATLASARAKASVAVADANRAHAIAERDRANNLLKTGGITDKDHLAAMVNLQVAEASLSQVKADAAIAAQNVSRCAIRAPFAGKVSKRLVDVGTMLAPGTPVLQLVDNSVLEFRASVPSAELARVKLGAPVTISVDAFEGTVLNGKVSRTLPTVDERSRSFEVVVRVAGTNSLVSGLFARGRIRVREVTDAQVVPPASLVHDGQSEGKAGIYVIEHGKAELREVDLGIEGATAVQIHGLRPGTTVVVDPPTTLASGAPVQIQNSSATAER